jgi:DNA-directed RNA polymerase specialized sigma24 family protein
VSAVGPSGLVDASAGFTAWYRSVEPRLRLALMATYGPERGREATAEALAWAWEHPDRIEGLSNPVAYLYRVGQSRSRLRRIRVLHGRPDWSEPWVEPSLRRALSSLSDRQRVTVVLVHGYGWTHSEVADLLGIAVTTVQNHLDRALDRLRSRLEVSSDG